MINTFFLTVNKSNVFEVINRREGIGSITIDFEDIETESIMNQALEACNLINPGSAFIKELPEGKYQLFFTREYKKGSMKPDDIYIAEMAQKAKHNQTEVQISINGRLHKLANKYAKQYGVKFTGDSFTFNGAESIIDRMKKAFAAGLLKMDLQTTETTIHTVRAYCAILKNTYNKTIYCRQNGPVITVWFRTPSQAERLMEEIKDRIKQGEGVFTDENIIDIMNCIWTLIPEGCVIPQKVGFEETNTAIITPEEVKKVADSGQIEIIDPNAPAAAEVFAAEPNAEDEDEDF